MPVRIGFDMDGVFADMEGELVCQAEGLFGEAMTRWLKERAGGLRSGGRIADCVGEPTG